MKSFNGMRQVRGVTQRPPKIEQQERISVQPSADGDTYERTLAAYILQVEDELQHVSGPERIRTFILGAVISVIGVLLALVRQFVPESPGSALPSTAAIIVAFAIAVFVIVVGRLLLLAYRKSILVAELSTLQKKQRVSRDLSSSVSVPAQSEHSSPSGPGRRSYFETLVNINVNNLADYYVLVKVHTEKSFFVCVAAGVVGFLLVMAGLAVGFIDRNAATIAYLSAGAGIITEIISGIFFYLYNRTVRQMKTYHDSLLAVQNILLSFKLLDDTEGGPDKAAMVTQMVTYLVGKHEGVSVLHAPGVDRVS